MGKIRTSATGGKKLSARVERRHRSLSLGTPRDMSPEQAAGCILHLRFAYALERLGLAR